MKIKGNIGPLVALLLVVVVAFTVFGALVGLAFGKMLIGAAIGAALPLMWCIVAFCFLKGVELATRGQWG